jgi:hypothetical protein
VFSTVTSPLGSFSVIRALFGGFGL